MAETITINCPRSSDPDNLGIVEVNSENAQVGDEVIVKCSNCEAQLEGYRCSASRIGEVMVTLSTRMFDCKTPPESRGGGGAARKHVRARQIVDATADTIF